MPLRDIETATRSHDLPGKWSFSLPPVRRAVARRANTDALEPLGRDGFLDPLNATQHRHTQGAGAEDLLPFEVRKDALDERHRYLKEIEALKRHCDELDHMVHQLRDDQEGTKPTPRPATTEATSSCRDPEADRPTSRSASACVGRRAEVEAACKARLASMEARLASMEAQLATEESKRADAEDELRTGAQVAAQNMKVARSRVLALGVAHTEAIERNMQLAIFGAWRAHALGQHLHGRLDAEAKRYNATEAARAKADEERLKLTERIAQVEAEAAQEQSRLQALVSDTQARLSTAEARCAAANQELEHARRDASERLQEAEARGAAALAESEAKWRAALEEQRAELARERETALLQQADAAQARLQEEVARGAEALRARTAELRQQLEQERARPSATTAGASLSTKSEARRRVLAGGKSWALTNERAILFPVLAVWHAAVRQRHMVGALQTKLFEEEACRGAALHSQKAELDARFAEAEAKHRSALHCLRAELLEAEARCAEAIGTREAEAQQRLAASVSEAALTPRTPRTDGEEEEDFSDSQAVRAMQARADVRLADAEVRHTEELLAEREHADARLALVEARQAEALRQIEDAAERRVAQVEARHTQAMRELQSAADQRLLESEVRNTQLLHLMQDVESIQVDPNETL